LCPSAKSIILSSSIEVVSNHQPFLSVLMSNGPTGATGTPILAGPGISVPNVHGLGPTGQVDSGDAATAASLANKPTARGVLATCDGHVSDYRNLHIPKAVALANIYTTLTAAIPEGGEEVERPFSQYLAIIDNHNQFITAAGK
jgi:hypothetical protein